MTCWKNPKTCSRQISIVHNIAAVNDALVQHPSRTGPLAAHWRGWIVPIARHERLLFTLLIIVHLIPIWAFTYLPTTDGAAHVANADVMRKINDGGHSVFAHY
jgi:hypothetical protein